MPGQRLAHFRNSIRPAPLKTVVDRRNRMNSSIPQSQFFLAFVVLLLVHTGVSAAAYRWLTKTTVQEWPKDAIMETTTAEQAQRGEKVFIGSKRVVTRSVPWPVPCYIIGGYFGLAMAVCVWLVRQERAA